MRSHFFGAGSETDLELALDALRALLEAATATGPVLDFREQRELIEAFAAPLPRHGAPLEEVLARCAEGVVRGSIRQGHPAYLAFPDSGNSLAGLLAELHIAVLNQNAIATKKSAPTGTFMEIQVLRWLRDLVGFPSSGYPASAASVGGLFVGGGVMGNTVALLAARERAYPRARVEGPAAIDRRPAVFMASETVSHYSHTAAAGWVALGEGNVVEVEPTPGYAMSPLALEAAIKAAVAEGRAPVAVIAQAGDSRTMALDDIGAIASVAERHGVWLHVDACHGGALLFSERLRRGLDGLQRADSVAIDPHKTLCLPYSCSVLLFRDTESADALTRHTDITIQRGTYDLGQVTPLVGSRRLESLKLWLLLQHLGTEGIGALVEHRFQMARHWAALVDASAFFVRLNEVTVNSVVFSLLPGPGEPPEELSARNQALHDAVYVDGRTCIHTFDYLDVKGRLGEPAGERVRVLGVTLGNPLTDASVLDDAFAVVAELATETPGDPDQELVRDAT